MRILCVCLAGAGLIAPLKADSGGGCQNDQARRESDKGVGAFKQRDYAKAVGHFRSATELDADCITARQYLATAYMQQYIPGADTAENQAMATAAEEQFEKVLEQDANDELALASLASLCFYQKKFDEATTWYKKLVSVKPDNKEALYTLGVIAWTRSIDPDREARESLGMKPDEPGPIKNGDVRMALRVNYLPVIEEGIGNLDKALAIDAEYDDAMAYLNLLYRTKADLEDSAQSYQDDIDLANTWFQKTIETRKAKASRPVG
jgi:Tfp pilus assembly protein PilF